MISICIINHDYARFLQPAIDGALALQAEADVEVVVVDDGSTDESRAVIASYGDRIRPVLKENGGQGSAFNAGFEATRGDIVVFLDADDVVLPGLGAALQAAFSEAPRPVRVQVRMRIMDAEGTPTDRLVPPRPRSHGPVDIGPHVRRFRSYPWPPSSANAYDAEAVRAVMPIPVPAYRTSCDSYFAELLPFAGPVSSLDVVGVGYRRHGANSYLGAGADLGWFQWKIERILANHERAIDLADELGVPGPPSDPLAPRDVAFLGYRLASLRLDPAHHRIARDRPVKLAVAGWRAALTNPTLERNDRLIRVVWFALAGLLPRRLAASVVRRFVPDSPSPLRGG